MIKQLYVKKMFGLKVEIEAEPFLNLILDSDVVIVVMKDFDRLESRLATVEAERDAAIQSALERQHLFSVAQTQARGFAEIIARRLHYGACLMDSETCRCGKDIAESYLA